MYHLVHSAPLSPPINSHAMLHSKALKTSSFNIHINVYHPVRMLNRHRLILAQAFRLSEASVPSIR